MIKSPCLTCAHHLSGGKKSDFCCLTCQDRIDYARSLGGMSHSVPDALSDFKKFNPTRRKEVTQMTPCSTDAPLADHMNPAVAATKKVCKACGLSKPIEEFQNNRKARDGHLDTCRKCMGEKVRKGQKSTGEQVPGFIPPVDTVCNGLVTTPHKVPSTPVQQKTHILVAFDKHPELYCHLEDLAEQELRTVEAQALYMLRQMLAEGCDDGRRSL